MAVIAFATCRELPDVQPDDAPIADALRAMGHEVRLLPWNGPFAPFAASDLVAVRSTWDYADAPSAFLAWLRELEDAHLRVTNAPSLMRWNARKDYLMDLAARGAPLAPTRLVEPDADAIRHAMIDLGVEEAVVKPVFGAGASGLSIVRRDDLTSLVEAAGQLGYDGLVQPLIPEIRSAGEVSLTFVGDEYSHAAIKQAAPGSILIHAEHGGSTAPYVASSEMVGVAREVLAMLPEPADYARVDLVPTPGGVVLMEVELIEPELFVLHCDGAAARFARFLAARATR